MLPGMKEIDDFHGAGELLCHQVPDPFGTVADNDPCLSPVPAASW
jgi:hypothetical protein